MSLDDWAKIAGIVKELVLAIAAGFTAWIAVRGLNKWHSEMAGKHQYDVSRALIKATYRLRDEIRACRSPFFRGAEFGGDEGVEGWRTAYENRLSPVLKALEEFETTALEAEALWGTGVKARAEEMRGCVQELYAAIEAVLEDKQVGGENFKADRDFGVRMRATVVSGAAALDLLSKRIREAVGAIEGELRPKMNK